MAFSSIQGLAGFAAALSIIQNISITVVCITATIFLIKKMKNK
jgi:hypothetical protein